MVSDEERLRLRQTFDQTAESYQRARPDYPAELFDTLIAAAGLAPGDRLLEVGCATGKATLPLARRGFRITCMELGAELAAAARRNLAGLDAEVVEARFEDWRPSPGDLFDLVFAATAWHWVDPGRPVPRRVAGAAPRRPPRVLGRRARVPRRRRPVLRRDPGRVRRDRRGPAAG